MVNRIVVVAIFAISLGFVGCAAGGYTQYGMRHHRQVDSTRVMSKQDVINLSKSGVSDSLIITMMNSTHTWFRLNTQDVLDLKNAGVSETVIGAMLAEPPQPKAARYDYSNYPYYPYYWYGGFYPYWYYPTFSAGFFYHPYRSFYFHGGFGGFRGYAGSRSGGRHR